jgi:4-amino-4-deoxy-L-arabinose transferase-like glycosyltransferase
MLVIAAAILCATVSPLQSIRQAVVVGLLFGMGMLVKLTVVITMPFMMVITLLSAAGADRKQRYRAALYVFVALAIAFASYLPWLIRNFDLYGHPTGENVSAVRFHWQSMWQAVYESLRDMTETFFAAAGPWNNITAAPFVTVGQQLLWFSGAGLVVYCFSQTRNPAQTSAGRRQFNILCLASATAVGVAVLLLVRFGIYFGQSSGRYLYPLLFPIAVLLSVGLRVYSLPNGRAAIALGFVTYAICFVSYVLGNYLWDEENVSKLLRTLDPPA